MWHPSSSIIPRRDLRPMRGAVPATQPTRTQIYAITIRAPGTALGAEMQKNPVPIFRLVTTPGARLIEALLTDAW